MKIFTAFAALTLTAAPANAIPRYHSIVNADGSAFTCRFSRMTSTHGVTHCYNVTREARAEAMKSLTAGYALLNKCADDAKEQGIRGGDHAWWDTCMGR